MLATFAFTFTNINLAQAEPLQFVGLDNYRAMLNDRQAWDSLAGHPQVRGAVAAGRGHRAAGGRADAPLAPPARQGRFPRPLLHALRGAVHGRHPHLGRHARTRPGWVNAVLRGVGHRQPTGLAAGPGAGSTRGWCSWASGASAPAWSSTWPGCRASRPSSTTRPHRRRRVVGDAAQHDPADALAGHLLHARPGRRGGAPVLPRAAGAQERHRRAGRLDVLLQPLHLQEVLHLPEHGVRSDAGVGAVRGHLAVHAAPVRGFAALGLLRRRAAERWPSRRAADGRRDRPVERRHGRG